MRPIRRTFIFAAIFILASTLFIYLASQSNHNPLSLPAGFLAADKGYGVSVDLTQYDDTALAKNLVLLQKSRLRWLRQPVRWAEIEPAPGQFEWQKLDRIFAAVTEANHQAETSDQTHLKLIAVLETTPAWARPSHTSLTSPPVEVAHFGRFSRAFANRYGQQLDHYQVWHEPNLSASWGNNFVDPAGYARLLREAALNIKTADPQALILAAALAPTLENNPLNLNEATYLDQLYQVKASQWFDIVAAQAYGFDIDPAAEADLHRLNFRRLALLRQVMLNHADVETPIWATAFGWNALPPDWTGQPSPWRTDQKGYDPPSLQVQRTAAAMSQARDDWPWLGPMLAVRWDAAGLAVSDPARGFALQANPAMLAVIQAQAAQDRIATAGSYPATHPTGQYSPGWRFGLTETDISRRPPHTLTLPFIGTRLDLLINRGPYRGYLWVNIDGRPANALPQNSQGQSYVVLYDPLRGSEGVTLAEGLEPGLHKATIEAEGGWGQWAVAGWAIYNTPTAPPSRNGLLAAALLALGSGLGLAWQLSPQLMKLTRPFWMQGRIALARYLELPDQIQVIVTFTLAMAFYFSPGLIALLLFFLLTLAILLRPDLGLALIAFSLSFFLLTKPLPLMGEYLPLESTLLLTTLGFLLKQLIISNYQLTISNSQSPLTAYQLLISNPQSPISNLKSTDLAALSLALLALLSTLAAPNFGVSMYEWRMLVAESVLFYFLVRLGRDYGPSSTTAGSLRWVWRLVDALVAGAVLHALIALYLYFFTDQAILAEGVRRVIGPVYSSPNNLSLFLDRIWPLLLAVSLLPGSVAILQENGPARDIRRWLYSGGLLVVSLALFLTFSKGALFLGLPAGILVMVFAHTWSRPKGHWRRVAAGLVAWLVITLVALIPLSQTTRFQTTFDFNQGSTGFFRLKVWQAALTMLRDHWWLGLGLNNFLYQYRTRYILPEAWQEPNLSHPHNLILDFGTRLGLGGILILFWLQGAFWINACRLYQKQSEPLVLGLIGSMAVFWGHGLVDNAYFLVDLAFIFFLTLGIIQRLITSPEIS